MAEVSVPALGIIFLSMNSVQLIGNLAKDVEFPSPYWGLFFYLEMSSKRKDRKEKACFRPRAGDYFLSHDEWLEARKQGIGFPSPCWGLFFYHFTSLNTFDAALLKFPSPCWGLFFYLFIYISQYILLLDNVSVPVLGIIFYRNNMSVQSEISEIIEFPSPCWGLFFYHPK